MDNEKPKNSPAKLKAIAKYTKTHYERIALQVKKGERDYYKTKALEQGYSSLNAFIIDAIKEKINKAL